MAALTEAQVRQMIQSAMHASDALNRFTLTPISSHNHTGTDSPPVDFADLLNQQYPVSSVVQGTSAATAANYGPFYIASQQCTVQVIQQSHVTDGSAGRLYLEILKPGQTSGAGTPVVSFDMTTGAGNVAVFRLRSGAVAANLNDGDRLSLFMSGTPTGLVQTTVTVVLQLS